MRKIWTAAFVTLIIICSSTLSFYSLTNGDWWGDSAGYLLQAKAILNGDPKRAVEGLSQINQLSAHAPGPDAYPWGYPLIVSVIAARYGFDPVILKMINVLFYALFLAMVYLFARRKTSEIFAAAITAAFAFSPISLSLIDHMRSDVVYMAISLAAILAFDHNKSGRFLDPILFGVLVFLAHATRTVGSLLLILPIARLLFKDRSDRGRNIFELTVTLVVFGALTMLYRSLLPNGEGSYFEHLDQVDPAWLWQSIGINFIIPKMFVSTMPLDRFWYGLVLVAFCIGIWKGWKSEKPILAYLAANIGLLIVWPEPQGYRFFAPIMPLIVIIAGIGVEASLTPLPASALSASTSSPHKYFKAASPRAFIITAAILFFAIFYIFSIPKVVSTARLTISKDREISGPFDKQSRAVYKAIEKMVPEDAIILFTKPREILFFTGRMSFEPNACEMIGSNGFALFTPQLADKSNFNAEQFLACEGIRKKLIYQNPRFDLYEYQPEQ